MQAIGSRPKFQVSADGSGVVGHAGARLLADLADATGLTAAHSTALRPLRPRGTGHDPGRIATDLAVMPADGGEAIADLAVLRDQATVFGPVTSTPTAWRLLADVDETALASLASARAQAREVAWLQAAEYPPTRAASASIRCCASWPTPARHCLAGCVPETPVPTPPATTSRCSTRHSRRSPTRTGTAPTSSSAPTVPDPRMPSSPTSATCGNEESVPSSRSDTPSRAVRAMPERLWHPALDQDGTLRNGAEVAELTGMIGLEGYPAGTRIIVRRERPHPGAQLSLFDQDEGLRHQVFLTDTPYSGGGSAQFLEVRHRGHACVEDHIRCGKPTGFGRFPSRDFNVNAVWLELSLAAIDLLAWTRVLLLDGELATAEPKKLRYRLLHVAARLTRGGRRLRLRISATWSWRHEVATAFHRLAALPRPAG